MWEQYSIKLPEELTIAQPSLSFNFVPQPDITAYELALLMPFFLGKPMYQSDFDNLVTAWRHLQRR